MLKSVQVGNFFDCVVVVFRFGFDKLICIGVLKLLNIVNNLRSAG